MKKSIVQTTPLSAVRQMVRKRFNNALEKAIEIMCYVGEECVKIAREKGSYQDRTGNLRSSIGYVVLYNGQPIQTAKPKQYKGTIGNGELGAAAIAEVLNTMSGNFPKGIALIVAAGMKYAVYVEAIEHLEVLASAEVYAKDAAPKLLKQVGIDVI